MLIFEPIVEFIRLHHFVLIIGEGAEEIDSGRDIDR